MRYEIVGETLPAVICTLEEGETMITEKGAMSWMSPNMKMETSTNGGIPEHIHCKRRTWDDCICIQLSGKDRCT